MASFKNVWIAMVVITIIAVIGLTTPTVKINSNPDGFGASGTRFPNGVSTNGTSPVAGQLLTTTFNSTGLATLDGGQLRSNPLSTSTPASLTIRTSDLLGYDTINMVPSVGAITITFPASSTMPTLVPTAGDMQETCWFNATTTAAATITFAASAGIDLETASSTPSDLTLSAGNTACFKFIRQPATSAAFDISALMTEYNNGD